MMINRMMSATGNDAELVQASLAGNREAFGLIVARYQSLVCSLAYSATGSLNASEDLAQETFLTAWKQLAGLREPEKLRGWLCAIARNIINSSLRRQGREPSHRAESLEETPETLAPEPQPMEQTISNEEQAILWRSLEQIPELYREPMVLFYREQQSVESVAQSLDLTENTVKQRLSRGRKMLQEQVTAFVEGALARTNPGKLFTVAVLASLPALTISAKAATLGAAAAKGSVTAKAAGALGLSGALVGPVLGFWSMWMGYRTSMATGHSERERQYIKSHFRRLTIVITLFFVVYGVLMFCGGSLIKAHDLLFVSLTIGVALAYALAITWFSVKAYTTRKKLLAELTPAERASRPTQPVWEYRSRLELLGLPFIHIRSGDRLAGPVKAWIAAGDCAFGVLAAFGGLAVAPISMGGCAVGLFSFGGMSVGLLAIGGMAVGGWSFGGLAVGWQSFGGCAIAWNAAWGGYAIARDMALGGMAHAPQVNNDLAASMMKTNLFFRISAATLPYLFWMNLIWFIPVMFQQRFLAHKRREQVVGNS
jgi:RNA polymerase sigma factor (sigma-70 family)